MNKYYNIGCKIILNKLINNCLLTSAAPTLPFRVSSLKSLEEGDSSGYDPAVAAACKNTAQTSIMHKNLLLDLDVPASAQLK